MPSRSEHRLPEPIKPVWRLPAIFICSARTFGSLPAQGWCLSPSARRIVAGLVTVAGGLGLTVVGEGVETEGQRIALLAAGCPQMQGYLFCRPLPASELQDLLHNAASLRGPEAPAAALSADSQ